MNASLSYQVYTEQTKPLDVDFRMEAAGCCIVVNQQILLLQRSLHNAMQPGTWGIPAGKLETGESPDQAARRETFEEAGIPVSLEDMQPRGYIYVSIGFPAQLNYRFYVYLVHFSACPAVVLEPAQMAYRWVTLTEALALPLFTGGREVLGLAFSG